MQHECVLVYSVRCLQFPAIAVKKSWLALGTDRVAYFYLSIPISMVPYLAIYEYSNPVPLWTRKNRIFRFSSLSLSPLKVETEAQLPGGSNDVSQPHNGCDSPPLRNRNNL